MRIPNQISFLIAALMLTLPAAAQAAEQQQQSPFKGGMHTMRVSRSAEPVAERPAETTAEEQSQKKVLFVAPQDDGLRHKKVAPDEMRKDSAEPAEDTTETEDPAKRVWNKYKALAAGKADEAEALEDDKKSDKDQPDEKDAAAGKDGAEAAKPTGFASILQRYEENKIRQSQMRTIQMAPPLEQTKAESTEAEEALRAADEEAESKKAEAEYSKKKTAEN